jgi:hypothetical protein
MNLVITGAAAGIIMGAIDAPALLNAHGVLPVAGAAVLGGVCGAVAGVVYAAFVILLIRLIASLSTSFRKRDVPILAPMYRFARPGVFLGVVVGGLIMMNPKHALLAMAEMALIISTFAVLIAPHLPAQWSNSQ